MGKKNLYFNLIIGKKPGARKPIDLDLKWGVVAAAVTKAQARDLGDPMSLEAKKMTSKMTVDK